MQTTIKAVLVAATLALGASSAMAAPVRHHPQSDPWVQPIHMDNSAVPAKQFFDELQRDSD